MKSIASHFSLWNSARKCNSLSTNLLYFMFFVSTATHSLLVEEVLNIKKNYPQVSLNHMGVILKQFGFTQFFTQFCDYIAPVFKVLYPHLLQSYGHSKAYPMEMDMVFASAMIVYYNSNGKPAQVVAQDSQHNTMAKGHFIHTDNSTITLNAVLVDEFKFSGGDLLIKRLKSPGYRYTGDNYVAHKYGHAIVHEGRAQHSSMDLKQGERYNLVIWLKKVPKAFRESVPVSLKFPKQQWTNVLPIEMKLHVLSYLNALDVSLLQTVNRDCHALINNSSATRANTWYQLTVARFYECLCILEEFEKNLKATYSPFGMTAATPLQQVVVAKPVVDTIPLLERAKSALEKTNKNYVKQVTDAIPVDATRILMAPLEGKAGLSDNDELKQQIDWKQVFTLVHKQCALYSREIEPFESPMKCVCHNNLQNVQFD